MGGGERKERSQGKQLMHGNSPQKGFSQSQSEWRVVKVNFKWKNNLTHESKKIKSQKTE